MYEVVDYEGNPVPAGTAGMYESLSSIWSDGMPPAVGNAFTANLPYFYDWIGATGNFTPDTNLDFANLQRFYISQAGVAYGLSTLVLQMMVVQNGMLSVAQPFILQP
jgi:hypothetical protein